MTINHDVFLLQKFVCNKKIFTIWQVHLCYLAFGCLLAMSAVNLTTRGVYYGWSNGISLMWGRNRNMLGSPKRRECPHYFMHQLLGSFPLNLAYVHFTQSTPLIHNLANTAPKEYFRNSIPKSQSAGLQRTFRPVSNRGWFPRPWLRLRIRSHETQASQNCVVSELKECAWLIIICMSINYKRNSGLLFWTSISESSHCSFQILFDIPSPLKTRAECSLVAEYQYRFI